MEFSYHKPNYSVKPYEGYLAQKPFPSVADPENKSFSLDNILNQDSLALADKAVNAAFSIAYRVQIYRDTRFSLESKWNELSSQIGESSSFAHGYNMNGDSQKSMFEKERNAIERLFIENKLQTWKDLNEPTSYFLSLFHKNQELKQDRKFLGD